MYGRAGDCFLGESGPRESRGGFCHHDRTPSGGSTSSDCEVLLLDTTTTTNSSKRMGAKQNGAMGGVQSLCVPSQQLPVNCLDKLLVLIKSSIPFLLFLFVYGMNVHMRILPGISDLKCVHFDTLGKVEESLFGVQPHRIISYYFQNMFFDFMSAGPYLLHYTLPIIFPLYLYCVGRLDDIPKFYWLLGWIAWTIYLLWLIFPHTPPWVIDNIRRYNTSDLAVVMEHREGCAFARLDKVTGLTFFYNMFQGNPVPYASFPSGHVAWPMAIYLIGGPGGNLFMLYVMWVIWATMYSCHHYLLDALSALLLVIVTRKVVNFLGEKAICNHDYKCRCHGIACPLHIV